MQECRPGSKGTPGFRVLYPPFSPPSPHTKVLLETTGCIYSSEGTLENSCTQHAIHVAGEHALEHRILAKAEAAKLFPGYRAFPEDAKVMKGWGSLCLPSFMHRKRCGIQAARGPWYARDRMRSKAWRIRLYCTAPCLWTL